MSCKEEDGGILSPSSEVAFEIRRNTEAFFTPSGLRGRALRQQNGQQVCYGELMSSWLSSNPTPAQLTFPHERGDAMIHDCDWNGLVIGHLVLFHLFEGGVVDNLLHQSVIWGPLQEFHDLLDLPPWILEGEAMLGLKPGLLDWEREAGRTMRCRVLCISVLRGGVNERCDQILNAGGFNVTALFREMEL